MNTEYLTHQEYFKKRANIIEDLKGIGIDLTYHKNTNNYVTPSGKNKSKYVINICTPNEKGISRKTALYHELGHLMWDSFVPNVRGISKAWATAFINKHEEMAKEMDSTAKTNLTNAITQEYLTHFNIIEDQRIESLTRNIWLGTAQMFDDTRYNLGELQAKTLSNIPKEEHAPADKLLAARFFQPNLSEKWAEEIMRDVEGVGTRGALAALVKAKPHIDEFLEDNLGDYKNHANKKVELDGQWEEANSQYHSEEATQEQINEASKNKETLSSQLGNLRREKSDKVGKVTSNQRRNSQFNHDHNGMVIQQDVEGMTNRGLASKEEKESHEDALTEVEELEDMSEEELNRTITRSKEDGKEEINEMKASLDAMGRIGTMSPSYVKQIKRPEAHATIDHKTARILQKTFTKMAEQYNSHVDDYGSSVDIESFINRKVRQSNDPCMINEKLSNGATVLISIDGSGSMGNSGRIEDAQNLVATLYKASEKVKDIELVGNVWSSDYDGNVGITQFNSAKDCNKITVNGDFIFTPTHEALIYSAKQLRGRKGRKKLMIIITDGIPQYYKNNVEIPAGSLLKMNKKALKKALRISPRIICIDISNHYKYGEILREIFGKRYVSFTGMGGASKFVIKEFRNIVREVMH